MYPYKYIYFGSVLHNVMAPIKKHVPDAATVII